MGDVIRKKLLYYDLISILLVLLFCAYSFIGIYIYGRYDGDEKEVRVKMNQFLSYLQRENWEETTLDAKLIDAQLPYCIFDTTGLVVHTTMEEFKKGKKEELTAIGSSRRYMAPIINENQIKGMLLVDSTPIRKAKLLELFIREIVIALVLLFLIYVIRMKGRRMMKRDIWEPIREIHDSTKKMLNGNYEIGIRYDYSGEIGTLCHDFEKMRDEIRERELREQQAAEKERGLYASISHDLKTPIAIIIGYLEQILYGVATTKEQILSNVEHALTKAKLLNKLTEDILEHSKAQMNQMSINMQELYADEYFDELLYEYSQEARHQKYQLTYDKPPRVLIAIDPDRIGQVMQNIVGNAVKYGGDNPKISISFDTMETEAEHKILIVSIQDNGKGIEATDLPFIFDLFYRGNKARTQSIPGSGLGLNISKYIVEKHGGTIECDSIVGVGTTVTFSIPFL